MNIIIVDGQSSDVIHIDNAWQSEITGGGEIIAINDSKIRGSLHVKFVYIDTVIIRRVFCTAQKIISSY